MAQNIRVLLIEDSSDDAERVVSELAEGGYKVVTERVDTPAALADALDREQWDLAIADYTMPGFGGPAALEVLRQHDEDLPFIFVSDSSGEDAAVSAMRTGADDYIMKANLGRLLPAVERELREIARGGSGAASSSTSRISRTTTRSPSCRTARCCTIGSSRRCALRTARGPRCRCWCSTSTASRRSTTRSATTRATACCSGWRIACAGCCGRPIRSRGSAATNSPSSCRWRTSTAPLLTAQKVLRAIEEPCVIDQRSLSVRASLGIACFPEHGLTAETLLQRADIAMYMAKTDRVGIAVYAAGRDRNTHRRLSLIAELRKGLDEAQFYLTTSPRCTCAPMSSSAWRRSCGGTIPSRGVCFPATSSISRSRPV